MSRLAVVLLALTLTLSTNIRAGSWTVATDRVLPTVASIQQLRATSESDPTLSWQTVCTAFSIDKNRQLFMTAAHCIAEQNRVDGQIAWLAMVDEGLDVAILQAPGARRAAIVPRVMLTPVGEPVAAIGHAYGYENPMVRFGQVSHSYMLIPELKLSFMVVSTGFIGGMSGGPIFDEQGRLVGIVQRGNAVSGLGTPTDVLLKATRAFWPDVLPS